MRKIIVVPIALMLLVIAAGCYKDSGNKDEISLAEIKNYQNDTLLWLTVEKEYTMGVPLEMVYLALSNDKIPSPLAVVHFNRKTERYQIYIEIPTPEELVSWKEALNKKEPVVLYRKP